jgi:hypothetical protein
MTVDELVNQIKGNKKYWSGLEITPQQVEALISFTDDEYEKVASIFLREPVADNKNAQGEEYRKTYAHLIYGTFLFCLRPNKNYYQVILKGALGIADPTSIKYGATALYFIKPVEQILSDLFSVIEQNENNPEILDRVAWLLYWLIFSEEEWKHKVNTLSVDDNWIKLYRESAIPETNEQEVEKVIQKATKFMKARSKSE